MPDEDKIEPDDATCKREIRFGRAFPFEAWNARQREQIHGLSLDSGNRQEVTRSARSVSLRRFHFPSFHLIVGRGLWSSKTTRFSFIL